MDLRTQSKILTRIFLILSVQEVTQELKNKIKYLLRNCVVGSQCRSLPTEKD